MLLIGGSRAASTSMTTVSAVQRFAVSSNGIKQLDNGPSLPFKMERLGDSVVLDLSGRFVYVVGGLTLIAGSKTEKNLVFKFDIRNSSWSSMPDLITGRHSNSAFMFNNTLYTICGSTGSNALSSMESLDLADTYPVWKSAKPSLPIKAHASSSCIMDSWVWISGGYGHQSTLKSMYKWKPGQDTWLEVAPMKNARGGHSMVSSGSKLYVFGGAEGTYSTSIMEVYDPAANSWSYLSPMPDRMAHFSAVYLPWGNILVFGGGIYANHAVDDIYWYSTSKGTWNHSSVHLNTKVRTHGTVIVA